MAPGVAVMQAADSGKADDVGCRARGMVLDRTPERRILAKAEVCPVLIVVVDEGVEQAAEMVLVEDDDVVEQFPPDGGDEALGDPVLPRAPVACPRGSTCIDRIVAITWSVKVVPRSKSMKRVSDSKGKASRSGCATQAAVGLVVTAQRTTSRRPWRMMKSTWKTGDVAVGTEKKSMAAMPFRWFRRNVVQVCPALGARGRERK